MDEAGQRGEQQRKPEPERVALVLQIGFPDGTWVLEKQAGEHGDPAHWLNTVTISKVASNIFTI